ncbi:NnrS family protein [bacterium]|nr:NnrS family protein [bacterium]
MSQILRSLFSIGFRPFFLGASIYSVVSILLWMGIYVFSWSIKPTDLVPMYWHAHEMIFGYAVAVIAGFLLTAVRNWTGHSTPEGGSLFLLMLPWLISRVIMVSGWGDLVVSVGLDTLFVALLLISLLIPIIKARQWRNFGVVIKLLFLMGSNIVFYLGVIGVVPDGIRLGLYSGLYLIVALIVMIGGRVIPFFIQKGVDGEVDLKTWPFINIASLVLFIGYFVAELLNPMGLSTGLFAGAIAVVLSLRLLGWYTHKIWKKPLLWVLYIAYANIVLGFVLKGFAILGLVSLNLSLHAFAYGAIGMSTLGMMSRVSWGHTGRNIKCPPMIVGWLFAMLVLGLIFRVLFPLLLPGQYVTWILCSQLCWVVSFLGFICTYTSVLIRPRVDN